MMTLPQKVALISWLHKYMWAYTAYGLFRAFMYIKVLQSEDWWFKSNEWHWLLYLVLVIFFFYGPGDFILSQHLAFFTDSAVNVDKNKKTLNVALRSLNMVLMTTVATSLGVLVYLFLQGKHLMTFPSPFQRFFPAIDVLVMYLFILTFVKPKRNLLLDDPLGLKDDLRRTRKKY